MSDRREKPVRPATSARSWTSFVAAGEARGRAARGLHEAANPDHRLRVEHDEHTLLIHLSGEDGGDWTTIAVDRTTRRWAVSQGRRQADTARHSFAELYER